MTLPVPFDPHDPVFVSYRQSDGRQTATNIAWALRAVGVPVWHDSTDLPPGETAQRLEEALESGLSGAVLVVTPDMAKSEVVRELELPRLLDLAKDSRFTLSIASLVRRSDGKVDYEAPDQLLRQPTGTLSRIDQQLAVTPSQISGIALAQARRRMRALQPAVESNDSLAWIDLQTRIPPFSTKSRSDLILRLRPPVTGQRLPNLRGLGELKPTLSELPKLLEMAGARQVRFTGGAHLSVACAVGAALPTTLLGRVEVIDTKGDIWEVDGQVRADSIEVRISSESSGPEESGPLLVYVDLLEAPSSGAWDLLLQAGRFAHRVHVQSARTGVLDPERAPAIVGDLSRLIRTLAGEHRTTDVHLALRCPWPIALLLGRALNTLRVTLYEWDDRPAAGARQAGRYIPSLLVQSGAGGGPVRAVLLRSRRA